VATSTNSKSLARDRVFTALRQQIARGELTPGEVVRDVEVAEQLGVSRTPVREALHMLEALGAVEIHAGVHTVVAGAEIGDIELVYPVLASLHGLAAAQASTAATEETIAQLTSANEDVRAAAEDSDFDRAREADWQFHQLIIDLPANRFLVSALAPVSLHAVRLDSLYLVEKSPTLRSAMEHDLIIDAIHRGDAWTAQRVMELHWLQALTNTPQAW
jgi:DNA-binding GntR family transcriptional regulator